MIEKWLKNDLSKKRLRRFKKNKMAVASAILLIIGIVATTLSPMLANSKPLILKYEGNLYFPAFEQVHPKELGITEFLTVDYRKLDVAGENWVLWPPIKWDPYESNRKVKMYPGAPSADNWLGTDDRGRDVFVRLLYGFKYSIGFAGLVWFFSYIAGILIGGAMGYFGGWVDFFGQRLVEVWTSIPVLFLLLILISIFQPSIIWLVAISSIFGWIAISYYVRGEFFKNRKMEFVEAARSVGASHHRIILRHIFPNSLVPVITYSPFFIASQITALAGLDYLGLGLPEPTPSWGELLNQAQQNFQTAPWLAIYPSLAFFVTLTFLNLFGEGVRDAMDPRLK